MEKLKYFELLSMFYSPMANSSPRGTWVMLLPKIINLWNPKNGCGNWHDLNQELSNQENKTNF